MWSPESEEEKVSSVWTSESYGSPTVEDLDIKELVLRRVYKIGITQYMC